MCATVVWSSAGVQENMDQFSHSRWQADHGRLRSFGVVVENFGQGEDEETATG